MGLTPDLGPIVDAMENMAEAIGRLATALDDRNKLEFARPTCETCESVGRLRCTLHGPSKAEY